MFKKLYKIYRDWIIKRAEAAKQEIEEEERILEKQIKAQAKIDMELWHENYKKNCIHKCQKPYDENCFAKFDEDYRKKEAEKIAST